MKKLKYQDINIKLINACRKGDSKAQYEIYKLYYKSMYNASLRILGNIAEAEDVMQEGFLSAFQKIATYKGEVSFGAWLKKIIVNRSLDIIKARKAVISIETTTVDITDESEKDYTEMPDEINIEMIKESIFSLPEGYRIVLSLYLLEGYDHDEISEILNITNATSRTQLHRAKKKLAELLNELKAVS